jgi:hypothetical protein
MKRRRFITLVGGGGVAVLGAPVIEFYSGAARRIDHAPG